MHMYYVHIYIYIYMYKVHRSVRTLASVNCRTSMQSIRNKDWQSYLCVVGVTVVE